MLSLPLWVKLPLTFLIALLVFFAISLQYHLDLASFLVTFVLITLIRFVL